MAAVTRLVVHDVTVEEALAHPTWNVGRKVTIHPQSLIHSIPWSSSRMAPRRRKGLVRPMEWDRLTLTFEHPDPERFPALALDAVLQADAWARAEAAQVLRVAR